MTPTKLENLKAVLILLGSVHAQLRQAKEPGLMDDARALIEAVQGRISDERGLCLECAETSKGASL